MLNLLKAMAACPGKAWLSRKAIFHSLCCCPCILKREVRKAWGHAVQARAARTAVQAQQACVIRAQISPPYATCYST